MEAGDRVSIDTKQTLIIRYFPPNIKLYNEQTY